MTLHAGDTVNLNGGDTFSGTKLYIPESGTNGNPIIVQSYGTGRATISVSADNPLYCYDAAYVTIQNIDFVGNSTRDGMVFYNDTGANLSGITLSNVTSKNSNNGLSVGGLTHGYTTILVTGSTFTNNVAAGVNFYGPTFTGSNWIHSGVTITGCSANTNTGLATTTTQATGFGMALGSISTGTVSQSMTRGNGANNGDATSGPVGLMVYNSDSVTVKNCISYSNASGGLAADGDGIDLDIGCSNCLVEYCVSYSNAGAGILLYGATANSFWTGNTARFNICWGNVTSNVLGEIWVDGNVANASVYNNTCIGQTSKPTVYVGSAGTKTGIDFLNNIFYNGSTGPVVKGATAFAEAAVEFVGNLYWSTGTLNFVWGANTRTSLASWRTSDTQEKIGATNYGLNSDPQLGSPNTSPSVVNPLLVGPAAGMAPAVGSPAATGGQNPTLIGVTFTGTDFWGNPETPTTLPYGASLTVPISSDASNAATESQSTSGVTVQSSDTSTSVQSQSVIVAPTAKSSSDASNATANTQSMLILVAKTSSDASNAATESGVPEAHSHRPVPVSDSGHWTDNAGAQPNMATGGLPVTQVPYAAAITGSLPGTFTVYGLNGTARDTGRSFLIPQMSGQIFTGTLPFALCPVFSKGSALSPTFVENVGWEVKAFSGESYRYGTTIPRLESLTFNMALNNEGAGQIVIDRSDPVFNRTLCYGDPGTDLYDDESTWQALYNGEPIFEFLGTTITEVIVDASSELQPITMAGAGTARVLSWAEAAPPGFPNVTYKLAALTDSFQLSSLNTKVWNLTQTGQINNGLVAVNTNDSAVSIKGTPTDYFSSPRLSAGYFDATSSAVSAKISPQDIPFQAQNLIANYTFELGMTGWDTGDSAVLTSAAALAIPDNSDSFEGDGWCAQVTTDGAHEGIEQTVPALLPNTFYQFNAWVKQVSAGTPTTTLSVYDNTNDVNGYRSETVATVGEWSLMQCGINTGFFANIDLICSVNSGTGAGGSQFLVDTAMLYQYSPYTSNAMILADENNPTTNYVMIELDMLEKAPVFWARVFNNGVETSVNLAPTYDPVQHNFWRIREYGGTFFFDTAPDGGTWTNQGQLDHSWDVGSVSVSFTAWIYGGLGQTGFSPMEVSSINTSGSPSVRANGQMNASVNPGSATGFNIAQAPGFDNVYLEVSNMALWLDLLNQAKRRSSIDFVTPTFTKDVDSFGTPWTDLTSIIVSNGSDLQTQLAASTVAINGDWVMLPNYQLVAGNDGILGNDLSGTVVFHSSGEIINHTRTRARDQIANYIMASDGAGNLQYETAGTTPPGPERNSISHWRQREKYIQSSQATDLSTLAQMANAALNEFQYEISQRTLQVPPELPNHVVFVDYHLGDWIGVENVNLTDTDSLRVVGVAISVDGSQDLVTVELTLETRIELYVERLNVLLQKIGANADAQIIAAPGANSIIVQQSVNQGGSSSFTETIGDGVTTNYFVGHGLNTQNIIVSIYNSTTGEFLAQGPGSNQYMLSANSLNQVTVNFGTPPPPNGYTVVIKS